MTYNQTDPTAHAEIVDDMGPTTSSGILDPGPATTAPEGPDEAPDSPPARWRLALALLGRLPQGALSRAFGRLADVRLARPFRRPVLGLFARATGIDLSEAERPLESYVSLGQFFVRRLRDGVREWPEDPALIASPVDAIVGRIGRIRKGRLIQAKGRWYTAAALLDDPAAAERYDGGTFVTLYLTPRHYHRIHAPHDGRIVEARYVPGSLLPVNPPSVAHIPELFARNERLVCHLVSDHGGVAIIAVGAYNVGRISTAFDHEWGGPGAARLGVTNRTTPVPRHRVYDPPVTVRQGDEVMAFHLGSTVVLLFEPGRVVLVPELREGEEVRLGEPIARIVDGAP